ncbi:16S rRNA (cytidine(1402)-2'-O)-methyltransferase, partial [Escherichia coli]|nr:16S rRNA (cytidine(1402)-2'-O)-methyltransferase [Escherichia coli]
MKSAPAKGECLDFAMDCRGLLCGMGNTGSMTSADELNEQYDADGSVTQVPERNDEVHAGESAVAQSRESAVTIPAGTVVLAATPIGNVGDASARLVALLERADIVAAEDTRRLYDLARRLGVYVNGRVIAYHDHNERDKADGLLDQVETGATVLVVSDAGMPTINDPGLAMVRRGMERGLPVTCA